MAGLNATLDAPAVALTGGAAKHIAQITAAANQAVRVKGIRVTFDGATSTATPPKVEITRPTTAGTYTAATPAKRDPARAEVVQTVGGVNASAEPTYTVQETLYEPAYGGVYEVMIPFNNELIIPGGGRLGIRVTAAANVNCSAKIDFEE